MKIVRNWIIIIVLTIAFSFWLFVSGRQHQIFLTNGNKHLAGIKKMMYSVDGSKFKKIRSKKKKLVLVKGRNHLLVIKYALDDKQYTLEKDIELGITENTTIDLLKLVKKN